eukprot:scaffold280629_cov36-Tisochrysis_lutea.AAC.4
MNPTHQTRPPRQGQKGQLPPWPRAAKAVAQRCRSGEQSVWVAGHPPPAILRRALLFAQRRREPDSAWSSEWSDEPVSGRAAADAGTEVERRASGTCISRSTSPPCVRIRRAAGGGGHRPACSPCRCAGAILATRARAPPERLAIPKAVSCTRSYRSAARRSASPWLAPTPSAGVAAQRNSCLRCSTAHTHVSRAPRSGHATTNSTDRQIASAGAWAGFIAGSTQSWIASSTR